MLSDDELIKAGKNGFGMSCGDVVTPSDKQLKIGVGIRTDAEETPLAELQTLVYCIVRRIDLN